MTPDLTLTEPKQLPDLDKEINVDLERGQFDLETIYSFLQYQYGFTDDDLNTLRPELDEWIYIRNTYQGDSGILDEILECLDVAISDCPDEYWGTEMELIYKTGVNFINLLNIRQRNTSTRPVISHQYWSLNISKTYEYQLLDLLGFLYKYEKKIQEGYFDIDINDLLEDIKGWY